MFASIISRQVNTHRLRGKMKQFMYGVVLLLWMTGCGQPREVAEANEMLDLIRRGVKYYYETPRTRTGTSERVPCQFPVSSGVTPPVEKGVHPCCGPDSTKVGWFRRRCNPALAPWAASSWGVTKFALTGGGYYAYEIKSSGVEERARVQVLAYGDLDCDGTFSTFVVEMSGSPDCKVKSTKIERHEPFE